MFFLTNEKIVIMYHLYFLSKGLQSPDPLTASVCLNQFQRTPVYLWAMIEQSVHCGTKEISMFCTEASLSDGHVVTSH